MLLTAAPAEVAPVQWVPVELLVVEIWRVGEALGVGLLPGLCEAS